MPRRSTPEHPTYTAIAKRLGLSVSAVSLVMKDPQTPRVSPDNRQRILAYVESGAVRLRRPGLGPIAFVIDRQGIVRWSVLRGIPDARDPQEYRRALAELRG